MKKTNYRNVFKSDHLGAIDLEEMIDNNQPLIFNIKEVKQEVGATVAGKKGNFNIAYFYEKIKPLVLNATNSATIKKLTGSIYVEDWKNIQVELYIDSTVKMKGEIVGGVRIKQYLAVKTLEINTPDFEKCKKGLENGYTIQDLKKKYFIRIEIEKALQL